MIHISKIKIFSHEDKISTSYTPSKIWSEYRKICSKVIRENAWQKCVITDDIPGVLFVPGMTTNILLYQFGRHNHGWIDEIGSADYKFARNQVNGKYYIVQYEYCFDQEFDEKKKSYGGFTEVTDKKHIRFLNKEFKKGHAIFMFE